MVGERLGTTLSAGLIAGSLVGAAEALWVLQSMMPSEYGALGYAAVLYGVIGGAIGLVVGVLLLPLPLTVARRWTLTFAVVVGTFGGWILDALVDTYSFEDQGVPGDVRLALAAGLVAFGLFATWMGTNLLTKTPLRVIPSLRGTLTLWLGGLALACLFSAMPAPGATGTLTPRHPQGAPRPDVLLVVLGSLRADAATPALDALAADGVRFDQHVSASAWSRTAVASLFTGLDPSSHGCLRRSATLSPDARTLAEVLQDAGYATGGFPATADLSAAWGLGQGFDWYPYAPAFPLFATESVASLSLYAPLRRAWEAVVPTRTVAEVHPPADAQFASATAFLDANSGARTFSFVHLADPGEPWFLDGTRVDRTGPPDVIRARYAAEVADADAALGAFLDRLRAAGRYDGMLIVVTADHGLELGEHGAHGDGGTLYDEQIHVPLVIKLPGNARAGTRVGWQVRQIDVAPTIAEVVGVGADPAWQGQMLFDDAFDGHLAEADRAWGEQDASRPALAEQDARGYRLQALRRDGEKVIEMLRAPRGNPRQQPPVQFFDLERDPGERDNLDGRGLTDEAAMQAALEELVQARVRGALGVVHDELSAEERARQCALGYLSGADCVR